MGKDASGRKELQIGETWRLKEIGLDRI